MLGWDVDLWGSWVGALPHVIKRKCDKEEVHPPDIIISYGPVNESISEILILK